MAHGVVEIRKMNEQNANIVRSAKIATDDLDNGNVVVLAEGAEVSEVWTASQPATGSLSNLWLVNEPNVSITANGTKLYRGLSPDPRDTYVPAGQVFSAYKLEVGNILVFTGDALAGTKGANTFVVATDASFKLTWAAAAISGVSLKLIETTYLSIPDGSIGLGRVTAYKFEVVAVA